MVLAFVDSPDKLAIEAPVLVGIDFGEHRLVLAPRLVYQMQLGVGGQDAPVTFFYAGGSVSFCSVALQSVAKQ